MITRIIIALITGERFLYTVNNGPLEFSNRNDCAIISQDIQTTIYPLSNVKFIEITEE